MDLQKARECLKEVVDLYSKNGFKVCLCFGTLLGAIREGRFLQDDWDIDLMLIPDDDFMILAEQYDDFDNLQYSLKGYEIRKCSTDLFHSFKKDDVIVDVNSGCFVGDRFIVNSDFFVDIYPSRFFIDMKEIEFEGCKVFVPNTPEEYLTYYYGANWRTPINRDNFVKEMTMTRILK